MRVKLTVSHTERDGEPLTYLLEQDSVVIGRAGTCDLPLEDPDLVVSKRHAELRTEGEGVRVYDMGSKNHTFLNGARVGTSGAALGDGDTVGLGPFEIIVQIERDRLVADDLDRTVFGAAFENPFAETAEAVATALSGLRHAYTDTTYGHRIDALRDALEDTLGTDAAAVLGLVAPDATPASGEPAPPEAPPLADSPPAAPPPPRETTAVEPAAPPEAPDDFDSLDDLFGPPLDAPYAAPAFDDDAPEAPGDGGAASGEATGPDERLQPLAAALARLISIPGKFRHEFLGHTVIHAPETAFLFGADVDALLDHLSPGDPALQAERLAALDKAVEDVLLHHQSLLEGYRAAAREGAAVLVNGLDPDVIGDQAKGGGLLGKEKALLDLVRERCALMRGEDFAAAERRVYRPAFSRAYLDFLAHARASS